MATHRNTIQGIHLNDSHGLTTCDQGGLVQREMGGDWWLKAGSMALGRWIVASLARKESELVHEVEIKLTSMHSLGSVTENPREGLDSSTLEFPLVRGAKNMWAYLLPSGILIARQ